MKAEKLNYGAKLKWERWNKRFMLKAKGQRFVLTQNIFSNFIFFLPKFSKRRVLKKTWIISVCGTSLTTDISRPPGQYYSFELMSCRLLCRIKATFFVCIQTLFSSCIVHFSCRPINLTQVDTTTPHKQRHLYTT